ncbi:hypothetical protein QQX98_010505 [Neonectria punicea]|uniref:SGNH hydrolase-type esterase domain-containing protein n=1 Tax=Neonectria punicea TaxID=979145 RepID=A0ABR1GPA3_9HYPO
MWSLPLLAATLPLLVGASPTSRQEKSPIFFLAGDSTTKGDGGWGSGFLPTLKSPAWGLNFAVQGTTTRSFVRGGYWANVTDHTAKYAAKHDIYVTISFGHNDQKSGSGVNTTQYKANLIELGTTIKELGGRPLYVTSLSRRVFPADQPHNTTDSLHDQRLLAIEAAQETDSTFIDLNAASLEYLNQIGAADAQKFNWGENGTTGADRTHLNPLGSIVFGRMVADLVEKALPGLQPWINENKTLSYDIWHGIFPAQ